MYLIYLLYTYGAVVYLFAFRVSTNRQALRVTVFRALGRLRNTLRGKDSVQLATLKRQVRRRVHTESAFLTFVLIIPAGMILYHNRQAVSDAVSLLIGW